MLFLLLSFAYSLMCPVDFYFPANEDYHLYLCKDEPMGQGRGIASIPKKEPIGSKKSLDKNPGKTATERRLFKYFEKGSFDGADLNGNGLADVRIRELANQRAEVTFRNTRTNQVQHSVIYNSLGQLQQERIDTTGDGNPDIRYDCKDNVCERKMGVSKSGVETSITRTTYKKNTVKTQIFQREGNDLKLVRATERPRIRAHYNSGTLNAPTEKLEMMIEGSAGFCFECYDKNYSRFRELIGIYENLQRNTPNYRDLKKIDDFYVSRVGVLIHEECFKKHDSFYPGEGRFDVEEEVTGTFLKGMGCMVDLTEKYREYTLDQQAYLSHIPRMLAVLDTPKPDIGGIHFHDGNISANPCQDYKRLIHPEYVQTMNILNDCRSAHNEIPIGQPKVICQADQYTRAIEQHSRTDISRVNANATSPNDPHPVVVNYNGKTTFYNHPTISLRREGFNKQQFRTTLWHEFMHNCGYEHTDHTTNDFSYFCELACFKDEYRNGNSNLLADKDLQETAERGCLLEERFEDHDGILDDIRRVAH